MSRARTERKRAAAERWPTLTRVTPFFTNEIDVLSIEEVGRLLEEWKDWNSAYSWKPDAGGYLSDVFNLPEDPDEGRLVMNRIYEQAIRKWRDAGRKFKL